MNLNELKKLVELGYLTNIALIEHYLKNEEELNKITIDKLLNEQGSRIVANYSELFNESEPVEDNTTTIEPVEDNTTTIEPVEDNTTTIEPVEIVVDEGEEEE